MVDIVAGQCWRGNDGARIVTEVTDDRVRWRWHGVANRAAWCLRSSFQRWAARSSAYLSTDRPAARKRPPRARKIATTVYLDREDMTALRALADEKGVPFAKLIRDGVRLVLGGVA
jgi:hypothetical protein